jgi:hypothetical protein
MNVDNAKLFYVLFCTVLGFVIFLPTIFSVLTLPSGEEFSQLWLLGSNHIIENAALNVSITKPFSVYLGVSNEMDALEFYTVYVKLGNLSDPLPNRAAGLPSPLQPIFEYNLFLKNGEEFEKELVFSFEDVSFEDNICRISRLVIDNHDVQVDKIVFMNQLSGVFSCQLIFELWFYNTTTSSFQFHNRSVWFWVNLNAST